MQNDKTQVTADTAGTAGDGTKVTTAVSESPAPIKADAPATEPKKEAATEPAKAPVTPPAEPVKPTAPVAPKPTPGKNRLGLAQLDYKGGESTLCNGCGHDAISAHIIKACFELGIEQHMVAKMSGIGCSSKSPAYFLGRAHGFNSVHGRMPAVATGAAVANRNLTLLGVSGDGDTASIGIGQFIHAIRRAVPMVYIVENNGVYGLTKGQFSPTADIGSTLKTGVINELPPVDLCALAIQHGCSFVARSFSGDPKQMVPLIKAALAHKGMAVIDVISPCVTFNDHAGSTKSRQFARDNDAPLHELGFVAYFEQITVDYEPGTVREVTLHDGSRIVLKKIDDRDYDPSDRLNAMVTVAKASAEGQFITGLLYINKDAKDLTAVLDLPAAPLASLGQEHLRPSAAVLDEIMTELK